MALKEVPERYRENPTRVAIPHNPCINAGAIMCTSLVKPASDLAERLEAYLDVWSDCCGRQVSFDPTVMVSERATADRNNALAYMMKESGSFEPGVNINETLEFYFSTCAVTCTAEMMATAAATLANGGENPLTQKRVFSDEHTRMAMSLMLSCGM
jgi:glutaminase